MQNLAVNILAAGKGRRINATDRNKVAYELAGKPMIAHTVDLLEKMGIKDIIAIVGYASESVRQALGDRVKYALQVEQLGTADALKAGLAQVPNSATDVLSVYGDDSAFYTPELINQLVTTHRAENADITFITVKLKDPAGLGRIVRDQNGQVQAIVEEKNATPEQKQITEINTGLYCFKKNFLQQYLSAVKKNPISGEYYLTDLIDIAIREGKKVLAITWPDPSVWFGVNTPDQWHQADTLMQQRIN